MLSFNFPKFTFFAPSPVSSLLRSLQLPPDLPLVGPIFAQFSRIYLPDLIR